jgi:hypothetical protein
MVSPALMEAPSESNLGFTAELSEHLRQTLSELAAFPLLDALYGRRSRRFPLGGAIPDGLLAYTSRHAPMPLSELERLLVLTSMGGTTGWYYAITRHARYAPYLANYAGGAAGRTFPSAAGFHTVELFFTDDSGTYVFPTRDAGALVDPAVEELSIELMLERHANRIRRLSDERIFLPRSEPYMEGHNTWVANAPGSLLVVPVADIAQHNIANLGFFTQNGYCIFDDLNHRPIPGIEAFKDLVDVDNPLPLTFVEQYSLAEATAELATSAFAGTLLLQAMGLGGWMFDGIDRHTMLGASGDPTVPGLGFRFDTDERWALPNPTGLAGVFEGFCPPHYASMADAVEALARRKFGPGGVYNPETPGAWRESAAIRGNAAPWTTQFKACIALQAQYIFETFGKFPGTVPTLFIMNYLQAQHIDTEFYDRFFRPGAYLPTHAEHRSRWHHVAGST